jgi:hypothetical protein
MSAICPAFNSTICTTLRAAIFAAQQQTFLSAKLAAIVATQYTAYS